MPASRSLNPITRYARWLHIQWPAGAVEKRPRVNPDGTTDLPGVRIVGDLSGIPLLKFSSDSGAKAVQAILADPTFQRQPADDPVLDLVIIGAGVAGMAAALEARRRKLRFTIMDAAEPFATVVNFPAGKPIYTYPSEMKPAGALQFRPEVHPKEQLLEDLRRECAGIDTLIARAERIERARGHLKVHIMRPGDRADVLNARHVIVAIGCSGNYRKLNVPGEDLDKVYNRLHDPKDFAGRKILVVGGGDSALETAIALAEAGATVTLSYRKPEFARPKPDNLQRLASVPLRVLFETRVKEIQPSQVILTGASNEPIAIPNDAVFTMIGRDPPLDFFRRSGVRIRGEWTAPSIIGLLAFVGFCFWLYHWKSGHAIPFAGALPRWLDPDPARIGTWFTDRRTLLGTLAHSASSRSFYYTLAYSLIVVIFGIRRIRRRKTPYVKWQTITLMAIQVIPLFILPEIILPWLGQNGVFASGTRLGHFANWFFEPYDALGYDRAYWRSYGFVLAWPLFVYNWFTDAPMWGWLIVGFLQTFVMIPAMIYFWGKGAYCGWICSCGALAETLGDQHRRKMPHGPAWNRLNLAGQVVLAFAVILMILRVLGWILGSRSAPARLFALGFGGKIGYGWTVDLILAGVIGYGLYFWFSGRVWCRFFCPLAALMHIFARFSRFRILADKKKCISCNVCTNVCHQGIDVMSFANKGLPMADPECVRCSACVQECPTGVLTFGQIDRATHQPISSDPAFLAASPVLMREIHINGKRHAL
jgi:thioredoxin reductase/ferredoxin